MSVIPRHDLPAARAPLIATLLSAALPQPLTTVRCNRSGLLAHGNVALRGASRASVDDASSEGFAHYGFGGPDWNRTSHSEICGRLRQQRHDGVRAAQQSCFGCERR